MSFFLYYILRRFFVRLEFTNDEIRLEKGILIKRAAVLPVSAITETMVKRTLFLRIFRAKEVEIHTINGKIKFYLHKNENLPFVPKIRRSLIRPRLGEILFGAFIDTRALGGIFVFVAILRKIGTLFGGDYSDRIIAAISDAAENVRRALELLHIAVPKIAATLAVFALASWIIAYLRKAARLSRFEISRRGNILMVKSGLITLYEHSLVLNSNGFLAVSRDTITTIIAGRAPLYLRNTMILPCVKRENLGQAIHTLCGMTLPKSKIAPPKRAFMGFCGAPLGWSAAFAASLVIVYSTRLRAAMLLKTALYSGIIVSLYATAVCLLYMKRSGIAAGESVCVSSRKGLRLYNSVFPLGNIRMETRSQSLFQLKSGLCNIRVFTVGRKKFLARQLIKRETPRCIRS
ncbi:MAG: PH domain-containing protein [Oscillospiraceae bacterium]|nr:PH domain-containing protein [Oscillospiraceae bacterium]